MEAEIRYMLFEDEYFTALNLKRMIAMHHPQFSLVGEGDSVSKMRRLLADGPEADLVITDLQLADGMAIDVLRETGSRLPLIVFTAYDRLRTSLRGLNLVDFVLKPISEEDVNRALLRYAQYESKIKSSTAKTKCL